MQLPRSDKKTRDFAHKCAQGGSRAREDFVTPRKESEKLVEHFLVASVKRLGGICLKYASSTTTGYPDRLVILPGGVLFWVEVKTTGEKPTAKQLLRHHELRALGQEVFVLDSTDGVEDVLRGALR